MNPTDFELDDAQISVRLATAIGWVHIKIEQSKCYVSSDMVVWFEFNYREDKVIYPIALKYGCFPRSIIIGYDEFNYPKIQKWEVVIWTPISKRWLTVLNSDFHKVIAFSIIERNAVHQRYSRSVAKY